uniref:CPBP family intramembrane metalloprotease n=1 Tax=Bosea sp. NBC_00436 TaxID=2969620 RepID=A0A9E8CN45_9HYPH
MIRRDSAIAAGQVLLAVACGYSGVAVVSLLSSRLLGREPSFDGRETAFFLSLGLATLLLASLSSEPFRRALALSWPAERRVAVRFALALLGIFAIEAAVLFSGLLGSLDDFRAMSGSERSLLGLANAVVLAPVAEEGLFRGLLFTRLRRHYAALTTLVVVTLAFGLLHAENGLLHVVSVLPAGAFLGLAREFSGGIGLPILLHACMNLAVVIVGLAL